MLLLVSTKTCNHWQDLISQHEQSFCFVFSTNQNYQILQKVCESQTFGVGPAQRLQFLVLIKRNTASRDANVACQECVLKVKIPAMKSLYGPSKPMHIWQIRLITLTRSYYITNLQVAEAHTHGTQQLAPIPTHTRFKMFYSLLGRLTSRP